MNLETKSTVSLYRKTFALTLSDGTVEKYIIIFLNTLLIFLIYTRKMFTILKLFKRLNK